MADPDTIKNIITACKITDKIMEKLIKELKRTKRFGTELDVYNFIKKEIYSNDCKLSFKPIVAMQKNAFNIHHKANNTKINKGFLVVDFGAKYKGYCSDCTRTFYIGNPAKKDKDLYNLVLESQLTALTHVRAGVYAADIDAIGRAVLWKYFKNFIHGTGHGVGKKIHQSPKISPNSKATLKENQVITIEPGLYFKNKLGIRIEDTVLVKNNAKILTKTKKEMIII